MIKKTKYISFLICIFIVGCQYSHIGINADFSLSSSAIDDDGLCSSISTTLDYSGISSTPETFSSNESSANNQTSSEESSSSNQSSTSSEESSSSNQSSTSSDGGSISISNENKPLWKKQIEEKVIILNDLKNQSEENETYLFFTDPHCFLPNSGYDVQSETLNYYFDILEEALLETNSSFAMCGGDLLNYGDTKSQACFKLSYFLSTMKSRLANSFFIVGNHDTNYQGDICINTGNWRASMLSQTTINDVMFNGEKSYYSFLSQQTSYYCFDSGVDFLEKTTTDYQWEQIEWFANSLLSDNSSHKALFIHITFAYDNCKLTSMMQNLNSVIDAFNAKTSVAVGDVNYDYSNSTGSIEFIQAGHIHKDLINDEFTAVPIATTTTFSLPPIVSKPSFDIVFVDYSNSKTHLLRIGDGEDRLFSI